MSKVDINILGNALGQIAGAVSELTKAISKWLDASNQRRMSKCIRIGDDICERIRELKVEDKALDRLINRYQKYNN